MLIISISLSAAGCVSWTQNRTEIQYENGKVTRQVITRTDGGLFGSEINPNAIDQ